MAGRPTLPPGPEPGGNPGRSCNPPRPIPPAGPVVECNDYLCIFMIFPGIG